MVKKNSPETRLKISKALTGLKRTQATKNKMSKAQRGIKKKISPAGREALSKAASKPIISMDLFGVKREFSSIKTASKELNICCDSIQDVANGLKNSTVGYTFIYKKDENIKNIESIVITNLPVNKRKIIAIDKFGNKQEFETAVLASETLKVHKGHIFDVLYNEIGGNYKTLGGYTFVWEDDTRDIKEILLNFVKKSKSPVIAIDKNGNEQEYESIMEMCRNLNISKGKMEMVLGGKRKAVDKSINGYTFRYSRKV